MNHCINCGEIVSLKSGNKMKKFGRWIHKRCPNQKKYRKKEVIRHGR